MWWLHSIQRCIWRCHWYFSQHNFKEKCFHGRFPKTIVYLFSLEGLLCVGKLRMQWIDFMWVDNTKSIWNPLLQIGSSKCICRQVCWIQNLLCLSLHVKLSLGLSDLMQGLESTSWWWSRSFLQYRTLSAQFDTLIYEKHIFVYSTCLIYEGKTLKINLSIDDG